ncbi:MAG TPA: glycoside hydrolase [Terriglobales bacterium]|nr:glycoside hydrolase [Terriglobales bacterium]
MIRLRWALFAPLVSLSVLSFQIPSQTQQFPESTYQEMHWRMIGPFRGGRTRAATGVPSQPNVFYIGQVNGGVWKSDDYGRTWNPIFDAEPTQSIGAIAVAPSDPNIIYVGSGEGLHRPDLSVGDGIYKSTDAGKTWTHLGLHDGQQIPFIAIDPRDPNRVFAAVLGHPYGPNAERGIFRSTDGGQTWQKVLYKDENTGGSDVEIDPSNPDVIYASLWEMREGPWEDNNGFAGNGGGLFKSKDGGNTWQPLKNGLPKNLVQIGVTIAPSQPNRIYASVATDEKGDYGSAAGLGIYRSDDAGESWYRATEDPRPAMRIGGGDLAVVKVDPTNADVVYSTSIVTFRSTNGGKTWSGIRGAPGGDDYQNIWINPNNSRIILLVSDQGAVVSVNGGQTWSSWFNQPTVQLYHVSVTNSFPYKVCGAQQESGSVCISSRGNDGEITFRDWHPVGVIEYGYVAPDPLNPNIIYGAGRSEVSRYDAITGQVQNITPIPIRGKYRVDRTEPIMFSPLDPHVFYYASNILFKTTDAGNSWQTISPDLTRANPGIPESVGSMAAKNADAGKQRGAIYSLGTSFKNADTLWAGTDDGLVWLTRDGGKKWDNITPPPMTAWSKVTQISVSRFDDDSAYISVSRFRINDLHPYIYRTHDGGKSWKLITSGLPDGGPVDTVREDPERKGLLFAGTENAVWVSFDDGDHWQSLQLNLPHTSMRDLWIHDNDLIVATHGRSFWILDNITPLRQISESLANSDALFKPAAAYRVRRDTNTDTPIPADEPTGENPPSGAIIDYILAHGATGPVTLEILDAQGKLVRSYSSMDKPAQSEEELEKQLIPLYWLRPARSLSTQAGMHRWIWDLHYPAPTSTRHEYPIAAVPHDTPRAPLGPKVLPGKYTVKLTVNEHSFSAPLTVKMDPRVKVSAAALQQQFQFEMRLASMLTSSSEALMEARSVLDQLKKLSTQAKKPTSGEIHNLQTKIEKILEDRENSPEAGEQEATLTKVNGAVNALYGTGESADAAPTMAQSKATEEAEHELASVMKEWEQLKNADLPALNRQLRSMSLPEISLEVVPQIDEEGMDEE